MIESMAICIDERDYYGCVALFNREILSQSTRLPILEFVTRELFERLPEPTHIAFCDKIDALGEMNSSIVTGVALQLRLEDHFEESIEKSVQYIKNGNEWFHCDHLAERVLGYALLNYPEKTIPVLCKLISDKDKWIVRMVGVAGHYAVKNGLQRVYVDKIFALLIDHSGESNSEAKRGLGRAAKTTARFHPDIVEKHRDRLENDSVVGIWFKTKIETGLLSSRR